MARIFFSISLALAALSVAVSAAPTTAEKRCEDGSCDVYVEPFDDGNLLCVKNKS